MPANGYSVTISATDKASAALDQINRKLREFSAPVDRARASFNRLAENSGLKALSHGMRDLARDADSFVSSISKAGPGISAIASGLSAAGMAMALKQAAEFGNNIMAAATQAQVAVPALMRIGHAASLAGGSFDGAVQGVVDLNQQLKAAAEGGPVSGEFESAMGRLFGHDWQQELAKPADQAIDDILQKLAQMEDPTERAYFGQQLLGGAWQSFSKEVQDGSAKLEQYNQTARGMVGISDEQAKTLRDAGTAMNRLANDATGLGLQVEANLAPMFTNVANEISEWAEHNQGLARTIGEVGAAIGAAMAVGPVVRMISYIGRLTGMFSGLRLAAGAGSSLLELAGIGAAGVIGAVGVGGAIVLTPSSTQTQEEENKQLGGPSYKRFPNLVVPKSTPTGPVEAPPLVKGPPAAADLSMDPVKRGLLDTIARPESGGRYDIKNGGARFSDFRAFPEGVAPGGTSSAAGRYQFISGTWHRIADEIHLDSFSPKNQDRAAWFDAATTYRLVTGRDLETDLKAGGHEAQIAAGLRTEWPSLPGGSQSQESLAAFSAALARNIADASRTGAPPVTAAPPALPVAGGHVMAPPSAPPLAPVPITPPAATAPVAKVDGSATLRVHVVAPEGTRVSANNATNAFKGPPQVTVMPGAGAAEAF